MTAEKTSQQAAGIFKAGSIADDALDQAIAYRHQQLGAKQALKQVLNEAMRLQSLAGEDKEGVSPETIAHTKLWIGRVVSSVEGMAMSAEAAAVMGEGRVSEAKRIVGLLKSEFDKLKNQEAAQRAHENGEEDDGPRVPGTHPGPPPKLKAELEEKGPEKAPKKKKAPAKKRATRKKKV